MIIKEVELKNFRIYYGSNKIELSPNNENLIIVSGKNGYGKTTFLMSIVWCLFGKQMEQVDDLYNKEIQDQGGHCLVVYLPSILTISPSSSAVNVTKGRGGIRIRCGWV